MDNIPVFIGYDGRETIAWHVLVHSIITRSSLPVAFTAVGNEVLTPALFNRPKGPRDSTNFSNARFIVPHLMGFRGWAIFMDCDMVCFDDLANLWNQRDEAYAAMVVKHQHTPEETTKFLGAEQSRYTRKNWSSLMLLNCGHPNTKQLTRQYVENADGLDLHTFAWADPNCIGEIAGTWNVLATGPQRWQHPCGIIDKVPSLLHYTRGGPWHGVRDRGADLWDFELAGLLADGNPLASLAHEVAGTDLAVTLVYGPTPKDPRH